MGEPFLFVGLEASVALAVEGSGPVPAFVVVGGAGDFFPEELFGCGVWSWHGFQYR